MKNILVIIPVLFFINCLSAQEWPATGSYRTNNTMGSFHGTWQWVSGNDTVTIYLTTKKVYINMNGGYYWDLLVGWHSFKRGSLVIESSMSNINIVQGRTLTLSNGNEPTGVATGTYKDISKNKEGELTLTLNTAQNQITWKSTEHQGMRIYGRPQDVPAAGLTLPRNMILVKQ